MNGGKENGGMEVEHSYRGLLLSETQHEEENMVWFACKEFWQGVSKKGEAEDKVKHLDCWSSESETPGVDRGMSVGETGVSLQGREDTNARRGWSSGPAGSYFT